MKIISGGQTGADRAGIDAAIASGIEYGGWLPKGRKAEDGKLPARYTAMQELTRGGYPKRTEQNIFDSDGTVIFTHGKLTGGSALTARLAKKHNKPHLHIDLSRIGMHVFVIKDWLIEWDIVTLNVAGGRESKSPGIYKEVRYIITNSLNLFKVDI